MKIAIILPSFINQGPVIMVKSLVENLIDKVELIDIYYFKEIYVIDFPCKTYKIKFGKPIDFDSYDIIHSHCFLPDFYVARWKYKIHKAIAISTLHQDTLVSMEYRYNKLISIVLTAFSLFCQKQFDSVIAISNQLKNRYNIYLSNKITTIYNGCNVGNDIKKIDIDYVNRINTLIEEKYKILGLYAYITRRKGLHQILYALQFLKDFALVIIGDGPDVARLKAITEKLKLVERVVFLPYIIEPNNYLKFFDVYMMTSYSEGFGLSMVEAALAKKSIVCSDIPSFHELFNDNEVEFFETDNTNDLVDAIIKAYDKKIEKGDMAYTKSISTFTSEIMAKNYYEYYFNKIS